MVHDLFEVYETNPRLTREQQGLRQQAFGQDIAETKAALLLYKNPGRDFMVWNATQGKAHVLFLCEQTRRSLGR
jgi:hypothetical protein